MGLKRFIKRIIRPAGKQPAQVHPKFDLSRPYEERFPARFDTSLFDIGDGAQLAVYWKDLHNGIGPAFSVHVGASEPVKFDCFGPVDGHFHTEIVARGPGGGPRIWLPEPTRTAQVERAIFELEANLLYYLRRAKREESRTVQIDPTLLKSACAAARQIALGFIEANPEMVDGPPRTQAGAA